MNHFAFGWNFLEGFTCWEGSFSIFVQCRTKKNSTFVFFEVSLDSILIVSAVNWLYIFESNENGNFIWKLLYWIQTIKKKNFEFFWISVLLLQNLYWSLLGTLSARFFNMLIENDSPLFFQSMKEFFFVLWLPILAPLAREWTNGNKYIGFW